LGKDHEQVTDDCVSAFVITDATNGDLTSYSPVAGS